MIPSSNTFISYRLAVLWSVDLHKASAAKWKWREGAAYTQSSQSITFFCFVHTAQLRNSRDGYLPIFIKVLNRSKLANWSKLAISRLQTDQDLQTLGFNMEHCSQLQEWEKPFGLIEFIIGRQIKTLLQVDWEKGAEQKSADNQALQETFRSIHCFWETLSLFI